jgi:hypothetical protein
MASPSIDPVGNPSQGHGTCQVGGTASGTNTVTTNAFNTWNANDIALIIVEWSNAGGTVRTISSVTVNEVGGAGANHPYTVNHRSTFAPAGGRSAGIAIYWVPLANQEQTAGGLTFTATMSGTCDHVNIIAAGWSGCFSISSPFDGNTGLASGVTGTVPATVGSPSGPTYSTTQAHDTVIAAAGGGFTAAFGAGNITVTGYTSEAGASNAAGTDWSAVNMLAKAVSVAQTGVAETFGITANGGGQAVLIIMDALTGDNPAGSSTETGTVNFALSGVSFNAGAIRKETATATLALSKVSFNVTAQEIKERGAVTLALSGIALKASGIDFGSGAGSIHFSTFGA